MNISIQSQSLTAVINHRGAELCSVKNNSQLEYIWRAAKDIWPRHAPVLFPIVGRLKNDVYKLNARQFSMPQHGFARDMDFELVQQHDNSCTFELRANAETKKIFPFEFILQISYLLQDCTLVCSYRIVNLTTSTLPFSLGAHPGFNCPLLPEEKFEDYFLEFEHSDLVLTELDHGLRLPGKKNLFISGKKMQLSEKLFDNDALVFEGNQIHSIRLCSSRSSHSVQLNCPGWPYFGIWSKKSCKRFVCLEPWFGIADASDSDHDYTSKQGLIHLPGQSEASYRYSLIFQ